MSNIIKKFVKEELKKRGYLVIPLMPKEKVTSLIQKLQPYNVGVDLIRLGPKGDGGYLVPDDLEGIDACFSPGVDTISSFEEECFHHGMKLFLADKSVAKPNLNLAADEFSFLKKYVGCTVNEDYITMDEWVKESKVGDKADLLLQIDIEGAEYITFINMSDSLMKQFRIMVVEFHGLQNLWNSEFYQVAETVFTKILQTHTCVHIHPNNYAEIDTQLGVDIPILAEFTFLRNDRIKQKRPESKFPHALDHDNTSNAPIPLPKNWYKP